MFCVVLLICQKYRILYFEIVLVERKAAVWVNYTRSNGNKKVHNANVNTISVELCSNIQNTFSIPNLFYISRDIY